MFDQYLITGATGFLGRAVAEELVRRRAQVHALVLHNDPYIHLLPKEVHTVVGDVCVKNSLADFFADADLFLSRPAGKSCGGRRFMLYIKVCLRIQPEESEGLAS